MDTPLNATLHLYARALAAAQTAASVDTALFNVQTELTNAGLKQDAYMQRLAECRTLATQRKTTLRAHAARRAALPRRLAQFYPATV